MGKLPGSFRMAACGLAVVVAGLLGVLTWRQAGIYQDEVTFFSHVVALNPAARDAHLNLGSALFEADRFEEGLATSRIAVSPRHDSAKTLTNVGREFIKLRQLEEAQAHLLRARQLDPRGITAHQNLAEVFREQARYAEAVGSYRAVMEIDPGYVLAYAGMGIALFEAPRHDEALEAVKQALEPDMTTAGARQDHHHPCLRRQSHEGRVPLLHGKRIWRQPAAVVQNWLATCKAIVASFDENRPVQHP